MNDREKAYYISTYNVSPMVAHEIVKHRLDDETIAIQSKVIAIQKVSLMATHNSVTKDDLIKALRWLFDHYEF